MFTPGGGIGVIDRISVIANLFVLKRYLFVSGVDR